MQVPVGLYTLHCLVLLRCFRVFDLLKVKELVEVRQVQRGAKDESSGFDIEGISATCYCMLVACVEVKCFGYLEWHVCREICGSHEIREIRGGHDVKSSKGFEGVVLVRAPRLNVKSLRIEQMVRYENDLPIVSTAHKCSRQDHAGQACQGMHTEGGSFTNTKFIRQETGLIYRSQSHIDSDDR